MGSARVAVAQIAPVAGDVAGNLALHLAAIGEARARRVSLLVFPELSLTGYESAPDCGTLGRSPDAAELRELAEAAGPMTSVVGFMEATGGSKPFNAAAILSDGAVQHVHRKINLPTYGGLVEGHHYSAGEDVGVFDTAVGRGVCLICADNWNPALPWLAALGGAEILLLPVASALGAVTADFDSRDGWEVNLRHTALTYGVPVVMANHAAGAGGLAFWGGSAILDAYGRVVARAGDRPDLVMAELDPAQGREARRRLPTVRDAEPGKIHAALGRHLDATGALGA